MKKNVTLVVIDAQHDFCNKAGSLYVPGADKDTERLSKMVKDNYMDISDVQMTIDSHHKVHIGHPVFWVNSQGQHPSPFTVITSEDIRKGKWMTTDPAQRSYGLSYTEALETNGRYVLCIWPEHCLIGSIGQTIMPELYEAVSLWEGRYAIAGKHPKGSNPLTEHYSAVRADVEDPKDPTTMLNMDFINIIRDASDSSEILIAGQALSHCVANTFRDIAKYLSPEQVAKCTLLEDACSSVPGFEKLGLDFIDDMTKLGMKISTTTKFF